MSTLNDIMPELKKAARTVAYKWPQITTEDDMLQDLSVHFLEREGSLTKLSEMSSTTRLASLIRVGHQIASSHRDDYDVFAGQFTYSVEEVRKLLENRGLDVDSDLYSYNPAVQDLKLAILQLQEKNFDQSSAILNRYVFNLVPDRDSNDRKLLNRAVDSLTKLMNRTKASDSYEYKNGGRHRNNTQALSVSELSYDGETEFDG
jgi:hypothetical protein